jgi:hypothetical protein
MPTKQKEIADKGEQEIRTKIFREFKGVNTKAARVSIPPDTFYDLVNLMPIGHSNLHTVPGLSASLVNYGADTIYWAEYANINSTDYIISFATTGKIFAYNITGNSSSQINVGHLFSGAGSRMDQWKNTNILFVDSTAGYWTWDGSTFNNTNLTGGIIPGSFGTVVDIAVFSNRVWLYTNRLLYISGLNDFTATVSTGGFLVANGALIQNITDPQARGECVRLIGANGYLYMLFKSSIFVVSDVYIPTGASPPTPVFTILNVQANIGCDQAPSIFPVNRDLMFANKYGLWALRGVTADRMSEDIDGTIQYLDTTKTISGGTATVKNIQCAGFLINQLNDPVIGTRTVVALNFDKKWWFANLGAFTFILQAISNGIPCLFGFIGNQLYQLFSTGATPPAASWQTALWPMEDQLSDKEVQRVGFEITTATPGSLTFNVDTPTTSNPVNITNSLGEIVFTGASGLAIQFQTGAVNLNFISGTYGLILTDGQGAYAKYVGVSGMSGAGADFELNSFELDYYLRKRW